MKELYSNGFALSIAQAIEEMKEEQGDSFSLDRINLAELERRSGVSRGKLRRLKRNGFQDLPRSTKGRKHANTKLSGYTGIISMLAAAIGVPTKVPVMLSLVKIPNEPVNFIVMCSAARNLSGLRCSYFASI